MLDRISFLKYSNLIKSYSRSAYPLLTRESDGVLSRPFLVPGACYGRELWDWDSWLTNVAIRQIIADTGIDDAHISEYEWGSAENFLEHIDGDGRMPIAMTAEGESATFAAMKNIHKPCIAQHIAFLVKQGVRPERLTVEVMTKLEAFIGCYRRRFKHGATGLYLFGDDGAIGVDNDPAVFYRPECSTASVYLNALMYKELLAMSYLWQTLGNTARAEDYAKEAGTLSEAVNAHLWDERNGMYYSADVSLLAVDKSKWLHSGAPRSWDSLLIKCDSWCGFLVLWAGMAPPERAERVIRENMLDSRTYLGKWGVRTLAKTEPMYQITKSGNPSCWLGPVWGISAYMTFRALLKYGYESEARDIAERTVVLLGRDIEGCGELHEYYHPDTGEGVNNQGFQSWNLLANNILAYLEKRDVVEEF